MRGQSLTIKAFFVWFAVLLGFGCLVFLGVRSFVTSSKRPAAKPGGFFGLTDYANRRQKLMSADADARGEALITYFYMATKLSESDCRDLFEFLGKYPLESPDQQGVVVRIFDICSPVSEKLIVRELSSVLQDPQRALAEQQVDTFAKSLLRISDGYSRAVRLDAGHATVDIAALAEVAESRSK